MKQQLPHLNTICTHSDIDNVVKTVVEEPAYTNKLKTVWRTERKMEIYKVFIHINFYPDVFPILRGLFSLTRPLKAKREES